LASELQQHFIPLIQHELNVDSLSDKLVACNICLNSAAYDTMPQACKQGVVHSRKQQPWVDSTCKAAPVEKESVFKNSHSTSAQKMAAEKIFHSLTGRVKEACASAMWSCVRWLPKTQVSSEGSSKHRASMLVQLS